MTVRIYSFGSKGGPLGVKVDRVFDCRSLRNPHLSPLLRALDGRAMSVQEYVWADPRAHSMLDESRRLVRPGEALALAFQCVGGRHRSVALAEIVAQDLREHGHTVTTQHRDLVTA